MAGEPFIDVDLSECCHATIGYDAWVDSNGDVCGGPYDHCICTGCGAENPRVWDGTSSPPEAHRGPHSPFELEQD
jgi:hypothetical protein